MRSSLLFPGLSIALWLLCSKAHSQDLIITKTQDSISCKLTSITKDNLIYTLPNKDKSNEAYVIAKKETKKYVIDFYSNSRSAATNANNKKARAALVELEQFRKGKFWFSAEAGISYLLKKPLSDLDVGFYTSESLTASGNKLRRGIAFNTSLLYQITNSCFAVVGYRHVARNVDYTLELENNIFGVRTNEASENYRLNSYIFLTGYQWQMGVGSARLGVGYGLQQYRNEGFTGGRKYIQEASESGLVVNIQLTSSLLKGLALTYGFTYQHFMSDEFTVNSSGSINTAQFSGDDRPNFSRLEFSLGLAVNLNP